VLYEIEYTQKYEKKLFKFLKKHRDIVERYKKTIQLMEIDPFHPSLRLHKLQIRWITLCLNRYAI